MLELILSDSNLFNININLEGNLRKCTDARMTKIKNFMP